MSAAISRWPKRAVLSAGILYVLLAAAPGIDATPFQCPARGPGGSNVPITANTNPPPPASTVTVPAESTGAGVPATTGAAPYDPTKDPGMGGKPPDTTGAAAQGEGFQGQTPGAAGPAAGGTPVPQPPTYTGTATEQPPGATGSQPLSPPYYPPCGIPGYPPCPPGYDPTRVDPPRVPWQGLTPPPKDPGRKPSSPPMDPGTKPSTPGSGGQCPPGCHIKPGTNTCHCGGS